MAFQVSPGVLVQEKDLTTIIPNLSTSIGGIVITSEKGPADEIFEISSEEQLVDYFGKPNSGNASSWYTAANFLKYSGALKVVRAVNEGSYRNATSSGAAEQIKNSDSLTNFVVKETGLKFAARTPGEWGNSLGIAVCPSLGGEITSISLSGSITNIRREDGTLWPAGSIIDLKVLGGSGAIVKTTINGYGEISDATIDYNNRGSGYINGEGSVDLSPLGLWDESGAIWQIQATEIKFNDIGKPAIPAIAGQIQSVLLTSAGTNNGYDNGTHELDVANGTGGKVEVVVEGNSVTSITLLSGGSGYTVGNTTNLVVSIPPALTGTPGTGFTATMVVENVDEVPAVNEPWKYGYLFDNPTGTSEHAEDTGGAGDEIYIVVYDADGGISGKKGEILERWTLSKAYDAKSPTGENLYFAEVLKKSSKYILVTSIEAEWAGKTSKHSFEASEIDESIFTKGLDFPAGGEVTNGDKYRALQLFKDSETIDVNLIMSGDADRTYAQNVISLCHNRKDCLAFVSPEKDDVVNIPSSVDQTKNVKDYFDRFISTSYAVFDSGWKYQYDTYNDVYRWVPLNGDMAGLCANTDDVADPWFSPAGISRGNIKSVIKLAFNPKQNERDTLYKARINPVVTFPGMGTLLWGDKTAQIKASAFDRINVRRLFIVLEKAIATASKAQLFELNDDITRSNFVAMTEPFLRDVQGRRGITDFKVVCDTSNNTGDVIDRNEFRADIYIKPTRSINFITLTFVATRTGVSFSEVGA